MDNDNMDVDEDNIHHQHYIYEDEDSSEVSNKIEDRGYQGDYLGLEHQSQSEPQNRYMFNNPIGHRGTTLHHHHH